MLHSSDIPGLTTPPSADAGRQKASRDWSYDERWRLSRATFLKGVLGTAVVSSVGALELFPLAPQARADGYDIYSSYTSGPCGAGQYASGHGCTPGCGPSSVCANKSCCSGGYHRNDGSTFSGYSLRPNQCWAGVYDGWRWRCNSTTIYRCHDGWTYSGSSKWKTICRHDTV